jgi:hypothetical protein
VASGKAVCPGREACEALGEQEAKRLRRSELLAECRRNDAALEGGALASARAPRPEPAPPGACGRCAEPFCPDKNGDRPCYPADPFEERRMQETPCPDADELLSAGEAALIESAAESINACVECERPTTERVCCHCKHSDDPDCEQDLRAGGNGCSLFEAADQSVTVRPSLPAVVAQANLELGADADSIALLKRAQELASGAPARLCGSCGSTTGVVLYERGPLAGQYRCWACAREVLR